MTVAPPADGEVHVWHARWAAADEPALRAWALPVVSAAEHARAERRATAPLRLRQLAASAMTRTVLARYLDAEPAALAFEAGAHGKPGLARPAWRWLRYNLSHSGDAIALAVAVGREVGVDVECVVALPDAERLAERFFTAGERAIVLAHSVGHARQRVFYRLWTLKEAYLKGVGTGITVPLATAEVELGKTGARLARGTGATRQDDPPPWSLSELALAPDVVGAVAVAGPISGVVLHAFQPGLAPD